MAAGSTLTTVGEYQKRLGGAEREFLHIATANFLTPLRNFLEGDWRTISVSLSRNKVLLFVPPPVPSLRAPAAGCDHPSRLLQKERRLLENRRLDLDICKARVKKAKQAEAKAAVRAAGVWGSAEPSEPAHMWSSC